MFLVSFKHGTDMKIGVVGFSRPQFDQKIAKELLRESIDSFMEGRDLATIEIISGLTNVGVPKLAYELAVEKGIITVGISAKRALSVKSGIFPCDKQIIAGQNFGDESAIFIDYIDCLIRVGGGIQSRNEVKLFKDKISGSSDYIENLLIEKEVEWFGR